LWISGKHSSRNASKWRSSAAFQAPSKSVDGVSIPVLSRIIITSDENQKTTPTGTGWTLGSAIVFGCVVRNVRYKSSAAAQDITEAMHNDLAGRGYLSGKGGT